MKEMTIRDIDAAVLAAVAQLAPNAYGVAIRVRVGLMLGHEPSIGAIHLALTRLEHEGMLRARTGEPTPVRGGRAKRLFSLTAAGSRALEQAARTVEQRAGALTPQWRPT